MASVHVVKTYPNPWPAKAVLRDFDDDQIGKLASTEPRWSSGGEATYRFNSTGSQGEGFEVELLSSQAREILGDAIMDDIVLEMLGRAENQIERYGIRDR